MKIEGQHCNYVLFLDGLERRFAIFETISEWPAIQKTSVSVKIAVSRLRTAGFLNGS
jgi:hypothetical protein